MHYLTFLTGKLPLKVRKITLKQRLETLLQCYFADFQHGLFTLMKRRSLYNEQEPKENQFQRTQSQ